MADEDPQDVTITEADVHGLLPDAVRDAYAEEAQFIAGKLKFAQEQGSSIILEALTFLPYVGSVFEEDDIGVAAATSDVNRDHRVKLVIKKIEDGLGFTLDDETKASVKEDINQMYNGTMDDP